MPINRRELGDICAKPIEERTIADATYALHVLPELVMLLDLACAWRDCDATGGTSADVYNAKMRVWDAVDEARRDPNVERSKLSAELRAALDRVKSRE